MDNRKILVVGGCNVAHTAAIIHAQSIKQNIEVVTVKPEQIEQTELHNFFERDYLKEFEYQAKYKAPIFYPEKPNYLNGRKLPRSYKSKRK